MTCAMIRTMRLELVPLLLPVSGCVMTSGDKGSSLTCKITNPTLNKVFKLCCGIVYKNQLMSRESLLQKLYVIRSCRGNSFQNVNTKRGCTRSGSRGRCLRRSVEMLSNHEGDGCSYSQRAFGVDFGKGCEGQ